MTSLSISPCCFQGGLISGTPRGVEEPVDEQMGRQVLRYHATPSDGTIVDEKAAVILFTDAFGLSIPNPKIMADAFADQLKLHVFVPAYIPDPPPANLVDPIAPLYPEQYADRSWASTIYTWISVLWQVRRWIPTLMNPKNQVPLAEKSVHDLQKEGFEKIAAVGYCRGGAMIEYLLSSGVNSPLVGGVIAHPSPEVGTWAGITKPTKWHLADHDPMFTSKKIDELKKVFEEKKKNDSIEFECITHKDTVHGFAARPEINHEPTKLAFDECSASTVAFFRKHLLGEE